MMMQKHRENDIKVEFIVGVDSIYDEENGLHITGILSIPRVSLNGWIYLPEELEKQHDKIVPMFFEHEEIFNPDAEPIGIMHTIWDESLMQLRYDAIILDKSKVKAVRDGRFRHVSMAATWEGFDVVRGWLVPKNVEIIEGSLVSEPGIPETTVSIIDHVSDDPVVGDAKGQKLIPTKLCDKDLYYSILFNSHRTGQVKSLPVCDMGIEMSENIEKVENKNEQDSRKLVIMDAKAIKNILESNNRLVVDAIRNVVNANGTKPLPTARVASTHVDSRTLFYKIATDSLKKFQVLNWPYIIEQLKANNIGADAIGLAELGSSAGAQWVEDITIIPAGLSAGLRSTCEVVILERGAKEAHFTLISTPTPVDGDAPNVPADATQNVVDVVSTPIERVLKQRVTDQAMRSTVANLAGSIAATFRDAEALDEDRKILTELNSIPVGQLAANFYAGNAVAESDIGPDDKFTHELLARAKRAILRKGWQEARIPGSLVCVMSPEQMEQLIQDSSIQRFIEWVNDGESIKSGSIPRLHGIDLLVSTEVPTGTGAGSPAVTTHRAFVYARNTAVGLAFTKDLQIETVRYPEERATTIIGSYELAAKVKRTDAIARIVSYGSG